MGSELGIVVPICGVANHGWEDLQQVVSNDLLFCVFEDFKAPLFRFSKLCFCDLRKYFELREGCKDVNRVALLASLY